MRCGRAMSARVRILEKSVAPEKPDFPSWWEALDLSIPDQQPADVEVMTQNGSVTSCGRTRTPCSIDSACSSSMKLNCSRRGGRGFVLESLIASLNVLTSDREHRIALISAAMGNAGAISQWLSPSQTALVHQSEWRGPRRLHAVFNTHADWDNTVIESGAGGRGRTGTRPSCQGRFGFGWRTGRQSPLARRGHGVEAR